MFALVLSEHADVQVNVAHAVRLLLVHDIVEKPELTTVDLRRSIPRQL